MAALQQRGGAGVMRVRGAALEVSKGCKAQALSLLAEKKWGRC